MPIQSWSAGRYFCSGVPPVVSRWVQYLVKDPRPDFINGPGITRTVAAFWPTSVYSSPTQIMAPLQVILILVKWKIHYSGLSLILSWWVQHLAKGPRPDFNNGPVDNSNSDSILAASVYSSPIRIMATPQAIPILER